MAAQALQHFQKPWQVLVSVCLTRMNLLSKELNEVQQKVAELQSQIEIENSVYNDHEHRKSVLMAKVQNKPKKMSEAEEAKLLDASRELANIEVR